MTTTAEEAYSMKDSSKTIDEYNGTSLTKNISLKHKSA